MTKVILCALGLVVMTSAVRAGWIGRASFYRSARLAAAAHRTLPFGTRLLVTNLGNGRTVEVIVVGRGPFIRDRLIDVSTDAAEALGFRSAGLARVRIDVVDR